MDDSRENEIGEWPINVLRLYYVPFSMLAALCEVILIMFLSISTKFQFSALRSLFGLNRAWIEINWFKLSTCYTPLAGILATSKFTHAVTESMIYVVV